ncbi:MAG: DUF4258 domain-containing protein [Magnetococcales bacterium]|nr:DUF4258 domain-containing protein [Magnetococcales bacterium]NGZ06067.1 DUF4258 domain-containing protein [Magnetococcales bacterium]
MNILLRQHALQRMFEREISMEDIRNVLFYGVVIEDYPDDTPYPSSLRLGDDKQGRPLHVVAAENQEEKQIIIITVYHPNPELWMSDWTTRRNRI